MALTSYLNVPLEYQEDDFSCVPVCIKMILEFVRQQNTTGYVPNMNIEEISQAIGTDELGTPLQGIEKINEKLLKAVPSIEFEAKMNCTFSEIEKEIQDGRPVIAWIKTPFAHSILVTGLNREALVLYYNDPQRGKRQIEMGKFMSAWESIDNVLIKVEIGGKIQRVIPEFVEKNEHEGEKI